MVYSEMVSSRRSLWGRAIAMVKDRADRNHLNGSTIKVYGGSVNTPVLDAIGAGDGLRFTARERYSILRDVQRARPPVIPEGDSDYGSQDDTCRRDASIR